MPDPYRARRWRERDSAGSYDDMDEDVRPAGTPPPRKTEPARDPAQEPDDAF